MLEVVCIWRREREKVSVVVEIVFMEEGEKNEGRLRGGGM